MIGISERSILACLAMTTPDAPGASHAGTRMALSMPKRVLAQTIRTVFHGPASLDRSRTCLIATSRREIGSLLTSARKSAKIAQSERRRVLWVAAGPIALVLAVLPASQASFAVKFVHGASRVPRPLM
mmetsp:Transcript_19610/g.68208  ORF Transcript_19610/g.68208 Transcript_19610/m.68208 type:complete len:128 (-) Transcript_19610:1386-1769(-)